MKYEAPELTVLPAAISAVQLVQLDKRINSREDPPDGSDVPAYDDWE